MTTTFTFRPSEWANPADDNDRMADWCVANADRSFTIVSVRTPQGWLDVTDADYDRGLVTDDDEVLLADKDGKSLGVVVPHTWIDLDEELPEREWTAEDQAAEDADRRYAEWRDGFMEAL
jgi:hypothetical protein